MRLTSCWATNPPVLVSPLIDQSPGVACDHQVLVGRDHPGGGRGVRDRKARTAFGIRLFVENDAEPTRVATDAGADLGGMLADPGSENERIDTAERCGE